MRAKLLSFIFISFSESGLFNALRAIKIKNSFPSRLASQVVRGSGLSSPFLFVLPMRRPARRPRSGRQVVIGEDHNRGFCFRQQNVERFVNSLVWQWVARVGRPPPSP